MFFRHFVIAALVLAGAVQPAIAHPHIWVDASMQIRLDDAGRLEAIAHSWTFDEAFSSWSVQGLDTNGDGEVSSEEMSELAEQNVAGLGEYDYFTFAGEGEEDLDLSLAGEPRMHVADDGRVVLRFTLEPPQPQPLGAAFEIAVMDPEWYVAIELVESDPVRFENAPGCTTELVEPEPLSASAEERLLGLGPEVTSLPPDLRAAVRGAGERVRLVCGDVGAAAPETAEDAVAEVAGSSRSTPFVAPPTEIGLPVARDGFLGWIYAMQRDFYQSLTAALGGLRSDNNAIWVLGTLSFLYGVFHAAGPGHGKVVISSYVLATGREVWGGIAMSFAAALVQATVAVAFVLIAAQILGWTSLAMSDAAWWLTTGSYTLVTLLGVWLVVRRLFGLGHHHHSHDHHAHGHHDHADDHGHHHAVTPADLRGSWRDIIGVVLAVGLRPCSGALVVLVFALSQGVLLAGISAAYLMALGTALTVAALASLAIVIKDGGLRLAGGSTAALAGHVVWWVELAGAFAVLGFGVILLLATI